MFKLACIVFLVSGAIAASDAKKPTPAPAGKVREYFIAAEEVV